MTTPNVPSPGTAIATLARLTLLRLTRGKLMWVSLAIAFLPVARATASKSGEDVVYISFTVTMLALAIVPALFIAPSIGEEIEDRTATYLWSRPLPRWTILVGKLVALAPLATIVLTASFIAAVYLGTHEAPPAAPIAGVALGTLAVSIVIAGVATVVPKHGMSLGIVYVIFDGIVGAIPASIRLVSVTHASRALAGMEDQTSPVTGAIALAVIAGLWMAVAFRRIGRLET
jgi:ABC-2 type transport system permease protein